MKMKTFTTDGLVLLVRDLLFEAISREWETILQQTQSMVN